MIQGMEAGGQLTTTTEVENFPGYPEGVTGPVMMEDLKASAESSSKYREEVTKLSENLSELNTIYGNMLAAMNVMRK